MKARTALLLASALLVGALNLNAAAPFAGAADLGNGDRHLEWFGFYNDLHYPWVYHYELGWLYCDADDANSIWLWCDGLDWIYTGSSLFPVLYEQNRGWIYYARGSMNPHWFFDYSPEQWVHDAAVATGNSYHPVPGPSESFYWNYLVNNGNPVTGVVDDITLSFDFTQYRVTFHGNSLTHRTVINADLSGSFYYAGQYYAVSGFLDMLGTNNYVQDALGLYVESSEADMLVSLTVLGQELRMTADATTTSLGELLIDFPWQDDLYELPVGTVYNHWVSSGWLSGSYRVTMSGATQEQGTLSGAFNPSIRFEIIDKLPQYSLRGRSYQDVVVVLSSVLTPDPYGGPSTYVDSTMWLAPGVGVIRSYETDPMLEDPIEIVLIDTNLW